MNLTDAKRVLIERIGIFQEKAGMPPVPARIIGLLLVSDRPELTFNEIQECLNVSKSAASIAINLLLQTDQIEYITHPGERKRFFTLKISDWRTATAKKIDEIIDFSRLLKQALELRTKETGGYNARIEEIINFMEYLHKQLPELFANWEKEYNVQEVASNHSK